MQCFFFFNDTATTEIYTLSLHDALPIFVDALAQPHGDAGLRQAVHVLEAPPHVGLDHGADVPVPLVQPGHHVERSEEHTSELQSRQYLVCRLLLEKKKTALSGAISYV